MCIDGCPRVRFGRILTLKSRPCQIALAVVAFLAANSLQTQIGFGFAIVDNSAGPVMASNLWCKSTLDPSPIVALAAGGADAMGQRATLLGQFAGIPGVQIVLGGAAPGTLTIDTYSAWVKGDAGGALLVARYDDGDGVPDWNLPGAPGASERWIQEINTNVPLGGPGSPYIDPRPGDDVKQGAAMELPYYWTDPEAIGTYTNGGGAMPYDLRFSDRPSRGCTGPVNWEAELFVTTENNFTYPQADATHVITIHDGIRWGFELTPSLLKRLVQAFTDTIESFSNDSLFWSPGIAQAHAGGTQTVFELHNAGVPTNGPIVTSDNFHGELPNGLLGNYDFSVDVNGGQTSIDVFVNQLDDVLFHLPDGPVVGGNLGIPVVVPFTGQVQNMSISINLAEDLIVIIDEDQPVRTDNALHIGPFSTFDPKLAGFNLLGVRNFDFQLSTVPSCDFDGDEVCDINDIDILITELSLASIDPIFDLNGDGQNDLGDRDEWLVQAGLMNLPSGAPYLLADFNLDGQVDGQDFLIWNASKFLFTGLWSQGDANADGTTDGQDFLIWNNFKFQTSGPLVVPEPPSAAWLIALMALAAFRRIRRK